MLTYSVVYNLDNKEVIESFEDFSLAWSRCFNLTYSSAEDLSVVVYVTTIQGVKFRIVKCLDGSIDLYSLKNCNIEEFNIRPVASFIDFETFQDFFSL